MLGLVDQAKGSMVGTAVLNADNSQNAWDIITMENILTKSKAHITLAKANGGTRVPISRKACNSQNRQRKKRIGKGVIP